VSQAGGELKYHWAHFQSIFLRRLCLSKIGQVTEALLRISNNYVGAQFRRLRTKPGAPVAIIAMAAKLLQKQVR
jgi:hypothetical protein